MKSETLPPAVAVVERLLEKARELGASDLHLDPTESGIEVRARFHGTLARIETLPRSLGPRVVGRCKALAELLVYQSDVPQEGRIPSELSGIDTELRVATYPTLFGERVALRLDAPDGAPRSLASLGLSDELLAGLVPAIEQPEGMILLTGPSGSGKTTTLYSCLHHLTESVPARAIVTIEDPIERRIPGVTQTEVNPAAGLDFPAALRSLLRQDPEVILVGEIRDRETSAIAVEAALTGHLVASTLHAGRAPLVFARLLEMGIEPFALTTVVRGVLAQRLLRRRCDAPACGERCGRCHGSGFSGRCLVAEWLPMSPPLRQAILARADGEALTAAASTSGFRSLRDEAGALLAQGITTAEELDRVLGNA
ncbi:MAG: GspE/PulE family protein [Planctomycetota bacterium]